jgi:hypothetical protein
VWRLVRSKKLLDAYPNLRALVGVRAAGAKRAQATRKRKQKAAAKGEGAVSAPRRPARRSR